MLVVVVDMDCLRNDHLLEMNTKAEHGNDQLFEEVHQVDNHLKIMKVAELFDCPQRPLVVFVVLFLYNNFVVVHSMNVHNVLNKLRDVGLENSLILAVGLHKSFDLRKKLVCIYSQFVNIFLY